MNKCSKLKWPSKAQSKLILREEEVCFLWTGLIA